MATTTGNLVGQYLSEANRVEQIRRERKKFRNVEAFPFWPHEAIRSTIIILAFSASMIYIAALMPYFLEAPANPAGQPEVILPDWYLLWSYGLLKPGVANALTLGGSPIEVPILGPLNAKAMGILLNIIITIPLIVMPFISTGHPRRPQEAPWTAAFGVAGIVYVFNVSVFSANNVIYTDMPMWGRTLAATSGLTAADPSVFLWVLFWVLPLPLVSFLVRSKLLKETPQFAGFVALASAVILFTIIAYGANLDLLKFVANPMDFLFRAMKNPDMTFLAWMVWWTTLLAFEVAYWTLRYSKLQSVARDTYEHGLNLTYFKVR